MMSDHVSDREMIRDFLHGVLSTTATGRSDARRTLTEAGEIRRSRLSAAIDVGSVLSDWEDAMLRFYEDNPEAFEGHSTREDWESQVERAVVDLESKLEEAILQVETALFEAQYAIPD